VWIHGNAQRAVLVIQRHDPPGNERHSSSGPTDFEVITNPVDPPTELPFEYPTTEIVDLVPGVFTRPLLDRVLGTEGMAFLEVAGHRDHTPDLIC